MRALKCYRRFRRSLPRSCVHKCPFLVGWFSLAYGYARPFVRAQRPVRQQIRLGNSSAKRSAFRQGRALLQQLFELGLLRRDPVGVARLIRSARIGCGLLDQLPEIVADNGNGGIELGEGYGVGHIGTPPWTLELTRAWMYRVCDSRRKRSKPETIMSE